MKKQQGFTLLEVMVAVSILAIALTAITGALGMVVRSTALASGYERARNVAENQMALFLGENELKPANKKGIDEGLHWRLNAEKDNDLEGLFRVTIKVKFFAAGGDRTLTLETRETIRTLPEPKTQKQSS